MGERINRSTDPSRDDGDHEVQGRSEIDPCATICLNRQFYGVEWKVLVADPRPEEPLLYMKIPDK